MKVVAVRRHVLEHFTERQQQCVAYYITYTNSVDVLTNLGNSDILDYEGSQIVVSEGLQEVECRGIYLSQLRRIIKTFKNDRKFKVDVKAMDVTTLFRYAAYTF